MSMHEEYLKRAFELSLQSRGANFPNPYVGAVIVKNGKIIGEGYHKKHGGPHAEVEAILAASESVEGADIYVTLEPCCHTNKLTPPCAQRLIQEKFRRVFIANLDPNPHVFGEGVRLLREHGITVEHGLLSELGESINEVFFHAQRTKSPFVHLKLAQSLDGKIALPSGESQWITSQEARNHAHYARSLHQAVMIGANTLRADNPKLNVRLPDFQGSQPYRIVFTKSGEIDFTKNLFCDELKEKTIIVSQKKITGHHLPPENIIQARDLKESLSALFDRKLINLYLEGGAQLAGEFLKEKLVQRVSFYLAPTILGEGLSSLSGIKLSTLQERIDLVDSRIENVGRDFYLTGKIAR